MQGANIVGKLVARVWDSGGPGSLGSKSPMPPHTLSSTNAANVPSVYSMSTDPELLRAALGTLSRLVDCEGIDDEFREQVCFPVCSPFSSSPLLSCSLLTYILIIERN
jgi:hypothetical protein